MRGLDPTNTLMLMELVGGHLVNNGIPGLESMVGETGLVIDGETPYSECGMWNSAGGLWAWHT